MGWLFVSPAMILYAIFVLLPVGFAFYMSFTKYDVLTPPRWTSFDNYSRLTTDVLFQTTLRNVAQYALMFIPVLIILSLLLAITLNRPRPGMKFFRAIYYLPVISSSIAASTLWIWMLNKDYGPINVALGWFGIQGPNWVAETRTAMLSIVLVTLWQSLGSNMVLYLAGLQGIPQTLYEAAAIDGASPFQRFLFITVPQLRTTTFLVSTLSLVGAFQLFDQAYVLTNGGPGNVTRTPVYQIWLTAFDRLNFGYAAAQSMVLFFIIFVVTVINSRINRNQAETIAG
jgi:multiple sugar transport system permease protein